MPSSLAPPDAFYARLKRRLGRTWWHPRRIGSVYIDPLIERAAAHVSGVLLDVGCGRRPHEPTLRGRMTSYVGLDWPSEDEETRPDVVGDALRLPVLSATVDTVLATELLEHLTCPDRFLEEARRVLRRGGTLVLSSPFMEPLHEEPRDYYRFTAYGLRALLERHDFQVLDIWSKGGWWSVVVGSFLNQALYDWANPPIGGRRHNHPLRVGLVLPVCALAQFAGYWLDRVAPGKRYTLGYVVVARQAEPQAQSGDAGVRP